MSWLIPRITQRTMISASRPALITCWPGSATEPVGTMSWSLPKAMFEPQKEIEPITAAKRTGMNASSSKPAPWRNSDQAMRATAPPPTPL